MKKRQKRPFPDFAKIILARDFSFPRRKEVKKDVIVF